MSTQPEVIGGIRRPGGIAVGHGFVWVASDDDNTLIRIDPVSRALVGSPIPLGVGFRYEVAVGGGIVWVTGSVSAHDRLKVLRVDPTSGEVRGEIELSGEPGFDQPEAVAVGEGSVWAASYYGGTITRINLASGEILGTPIPVPTPYWIAVSEGSAWVLGSSIAVEAGLARNIRTVTRIDAASGEVVEDPVALEATQIAVGAGVVWACIPEDGVVLSFDPASGRVVDDPIPVVGWPTSIAFGDGRIWVGSGGQQEYVSCIDAGTRTPIGEPVPVGVEPHRIAVGEGAAWVSIQYEDTVARIPSP